MREKGRLNPHADSDPLVALHLWSFLASFFFYTTVLRVLYVIGRRPDSFATGQKTTQSGSFKTKKQNKADKQSYYNKIWKANPLNLSYFRRFCLKPCRLLFSAANNNKKDRLFIWRETSTHKWSQRNGEECFKNCYSILFVMFWLRNIYLLVTAAYLYIIFSLTLSLLSL